MKTLIISNFRTGSWHIHNTFSELGSLPLGELFYNLNNTIEENINQYKFNDNVVAKLHPSQLVEKRKSAILRLCYQICEVADNIVYTQRQDTKQQVISYAVALIQFNKADKTPWLENRKVYKEELSNEYLDEIFKRLETNQLLIEEIYKKFPGEAITLEKDLDQTPYPNKYNYKGDWNVPYNFKMLGEEI